MRCRVAIAGASGRFGWALCRHLAAEHEVIGLSRFEREARAGVSWRRCDLITLLDCERALADVDVGVYLVQSQGRSARLTQARSADINLMLADNFARAAHSQGLRQIVFLTEQPPSEGARAREVTAQREVSQALKGYGVPVTTMRAGMIAGRGGRIYKVSRWLGGRLPMQQWGAADASAQPVAVSDALARMAAVIDAPRHLGKTYNIRPTGNESVPPENEPSPPSQHVVATVRNTVRSVQRLPNPRGMSAAELARAYMAWMPRALRPLLTVQDTEDGYAFVLWPLKKPLLAMRREAERSGPDRELMMVVGGILARTEDSRGRLEFRTLPVNEPPAALVAIHDFVPRLPWVLYRMTQAVAHLLVMLAFGRYLGRHGELPTANS